MGLSNIMESDNNKYSDDYDEEYAHQHHFAHTNNHQSSSGRDSSKVEHIFYEQQVDHIISKWKELLDRSQLDVQKYRNLYHSERNINKKMHGTVDALRSKH